MTSPIMALSRTEVAAGVRELLAEELKIDKATVGDDAVLRELSGVDSVHLLRVVARIERLWQVEFDDEDVFASTTVDDLVALILRYAGR